MLRHRSLVLLFVHSLALIAWGQNPTPTASGKLDFAHQIAPILKKHCGKCHLGEVQKGEFSLNTRQTLLKGGESGAVVTPGQVDASRLIDLVLSTDEDERMPPEGERLTDREVELLRQWVTAGIPWEEGFSFAKLNYEPPLLPRRPELPAARAGRDHPLDRILDDYLTRQGRALPEPVDDATFFRRVHLDLHGLLPDPEKLDAFFQDGSPDRRERLIDSLLADDQPYAEHWLTFWNDLLRNDYGGTGFITGGRQQVSRWLYDSLIANKSYDRMARELINPPTNDSRGFIDGIKWRGEVSAGQTLEIQFAQSISQSFLGINMKCASCHDSFIDRWKLDEAYGLAAIYATRPMEVYRCDKPAGRPAVASWLFPEIGQVDGTAPQPERLRQLAELMTHPKNGRFSRTMVNRLWHQLMGHGIVHPPDAMQTEPWNADLLDFLAVDFAEHGYDLKHTLRRIATSQAYQSRTSPVAEGTDTQGFVYGGPRARRLTAEQFVDAIWQLTGAAPQKFDAPVVRGKVDPQLAAGLKLAGKWIWSSDGTAAPHQAGEKISLRKRLDLDSVPQRAGAAITCDNAFTLFVNGRKVATSDNWQQPLPVALAGLVRGKNEILIVAENGGQGPNPAGLYFEARLRVADVDQSLVSDSSWEWTKQLPNAKGKFATPADDWRPASVVANQDIWQGAREGLQQSLARSMLGPQAMVRSGLLKSDFLMRSLGRPNRDQIVSVRPNELSTLEAIDLSNGQILANWLAQGGRQLVERPWNDQESLVRWVYRAALCRPPTTEELTVGLEMLGSPMSPTGIEDLLWSVTMLPEFHYVR